MDAENQCERIVLELVPLPSDRPLAIRLRRVLKELLRREQFRCVKLSGGPAPAAEDKEGGRDDEQDDG